MKKFENKDHIFFITSYSKYQIVYLNREIISLKDILISYMDKELEELVNMFESEEIGLQNLQISLPLNNLPFILDRKFSFTKNANWFEVLKGIYCLRSMELKNEMNITFDNGSLLLEIPDPHGVLEVNEVFFQVHKNRFTGLKIIQKRPFMYWNPYFYPGDYRIVECVDKEKLHHLYNVFVLPTRNCKSSFAAECSGGDLDGDYFSVICDENFVPPSNFSSCQYSKLSKEDNHQRENVINVRLIGKYFPEFMENDILLRIAHIHLALCDIQNKVAHDNLAIEVVKCHAQAIYYPKTTTKPTIPNEAVEMNSQRKF